MATTLQRNDICRCGSGKKYKHCCQHKDKAKKVSKFGMIVLGFAVAFGFLLAWLAIFGENSTQTCPPGTTWSSTHQHCH